MLVTSLLHSGRHPFRAGVVAWFLFAPLLAPLRASEPTSPEGTPVLAPILAPEVELSGELAGGAFRSFTIPAPAGTEAGPRLLVALEQEGIDLALELRAGDGALLVAVDGPTDSEGMESLLLPPGPAAPLELRLVSPNPGAAPGRYRLRLLRLPAGTDVERQRIEAERLLSEAGARNREGAAGSAPALRLAASSYDQARALWWTLKDRPQEARSALAAAAVELLLGEPRPALERALGALALYRELGEPRGEKGALGTLGLARTALGAHAEAIATQTAALAIVVRTGAPSEEGKVRNNLGYALHAKGDLGPAREQYVRALELFGQAGERGWWEAAVLQNLAAVETALGEPESALASHRRVLARQRELGDRRGEAQTLNNLGVLQDGLGEDGEAREAYAAALALVRAFGDRFWEAALLHNLGLVDHRMGDLPRARRNLEAALAIREEIGDRSGAARTEAAIASVLGRLGEVEPARGAARRGVALATAAGDRGGEIVARRLAGSLALAAGDAAGSLDDLTRAGELATLAGDRAEQAAAESELGVARFTLGETEAGLRLLRSALAGARAVGNPVRITSVLIRLARAERRLGDSAAARGHVEEALRLIEARRALEPDPELRATELAARHEAYELEIDLLMEEERRAPGRGSAAAAFAASERARARSLLDLLEEAGTEVRSGIEPELYARERSLLFRLRAKERQREAARRRPGAVPAPEREAEIRTLLEELTQVEREIRQRSPRYAGLTRPALASLAEIQGLLAQDTLLLEYALGEERSYLWAVDRAGLSTHVLPPRAEIESAARDLQRSLSRFDPEETVFAAATRLSRLVLAPAAARLGNRRLVVIADGALGSIPFAVLPEPEAAPGTALLLLDRREVVYAASASTVAAQRRSARPAPAPLSVAVLADPVFEPGDPRVVHPPAAPKAEAAPRRSDGEEAPQRLPWTRREAEAIAEVARSAAGVLDASVPLPAPPPLLALDFRASRETALSAEVGRYGILHIATHGRIDGQTPALSGLLLSRVDPAGAPLDGFLGLRDIYNLRLEADLVVLSGCETALGRELRGEGLFGLTQGFLYAGARRVLASLWRVEDRATAELMSRFYRALLLEGRTAAAALRQAQLALRADRRWRSPSSWGGFVLQGDWGDPAGWPARSGLPPGASETGRVR